MSEDRQINRALLSRADFYLGATLGEGAFARVLHARLKPIVQGITTSEDNFAMKIMDKAHIVKEDKVKHVMMEIKMLGGLSHPFIIKLHYSFQDSNHLYVVMGLEPGGELASLINRKREANEANGITDEACDLMMTKFYTAEIVEALEYLHKKNIIHRDLKPENIIISEAGHIKIADFGTAFNFDESDGSSNLDRFVGTAEYLSPEILDCDSEDFAEETEDDVVAFTIAYDIWGLGCIVFQMLCGRTPFRAGTEYLIFENIKNYAKGVSPIEFPHSINGPSKDFIEALLHKDPNERLGAGSDEAGLGYVALKSHAFFADTPWGSLGDQTVPFIPDPFCSPDIADMHDGALEDWDVERDSESWQKSVKTRIPNPRPSTDSTGSPHSATSSTSSSNPSVFRFSQFINEGETVVFSGPVWKRKPKIGLFLARRKSLFCDKRILMLTSTPRLFYIDPDVMDIKGEIPWNDRNSIKCTEINANAFDVLCKVTGRSYHFMMDGTESSQQWVSAIQSFCDV